MSPDFFDAEEFPQLKFSSTQLSVDDDGSVRLAASSRSTARPARSRRPVASARSAPTSAATRVGLSLATAVDRRDFGLDWNAELPRGGQALEYEVAINVELELVAQESE